MKVTHFPEQNAMLSLPPSPPTPIHLAQDSFATATMCWKMSPAERILALLTGRVWLEVRTFGRGVQAQRLSILKPEIACQVHRVPLPSPITTPTSSPGLDALAAHTASAAAAPPPSISALAQDRSIASSPVSSAPQ